MEIKIKQVDAFTSIPFGGNPAGVVTDAAALSDELKQKIAMEMNLSETAFVSPSKVADFKVQFFTPRFEVDLCGHATIGTFAALHEEGKLDAGKNIFFQETKAGVLPVELTSINNEKVFMMTQALPKFESFDLSKSKVAGLMGLSEEDLMDLPAMRVSTGIWWLVFGVKKLDKLMNAKPDLNTIEKLSGEYNFVGITPFSLEVLDSKYDYHLRSIAPYAGIAEDPVCGTGNGCVASYVVQNKLVQCDEAIDMIGEEGHTVNRPGCVYASISRENGKINRVRIGGKAVTVLQGIINA
ncbi:MAG: PhzF family phenazine biosynthesis protein [Clostridiaceae bacterium]|nr:PhzF family phenazine biosynthesis protein [Clostridiaceae bacterium]